MGSKRDISPLGTSKFERPYEPPSSKTSPTGSPVHANSLTLPFSRYNYYHYHQRGLSNTSTVETFSTAPTSLDTAILDRAAIEAEFKEIEKPVRDDLFPTLPEDAWEDVEDDEMYQHHHHQITNSAWSDSGKDSGHESASYIPSDPLPSEKTTDSVYNFPIFDSRGQSIPFGALFDPAATNHQRQLIIFVRYFYCPACTAYVKALTAGIPSREYFSLSTPTSITIIGCGAPDLIPHYKAFTGCPFPVYVDPTRSLFKRLGMSISFNVGTRKPDYMEKGILGASRDEIEILKVSLKEEGGIRKRDLVRGGHPMQVGGEFLFEDGQVVWCHRMRNYRGHAGVAGLRRLIGLDE